MSLEDEFDEDISREIDGMLSRLIDIVDRDGRSKTVTANVGEFMEMREFSDRAHTVRIVNAAQVVILKESNPDFEQFLRARKLTVIPDRWTCVVDGREFSLTSSTSDEVSWSFAIKESGAA